MTVNSNLFVASQRDYGICYCLNVYRIYAFIILWCLNRESITASLLISSLCNQMFVFPALILFCLYVRSISVFVNMYFFLLSVVLLQMLRLSLAFFFPHSVIFQLHIFFVIMDTESNSPNVEAFWVCFTKLSWIIFAVSSTSVLELWGVALCC